MLKYARHAFAVVTAACALAVAAPALAQRTEVSADVLSYRWQSGLANQHVVRVEGANALRLRFEGVQLSPGSVLRITSLADGARQHLNATTLKQWGHSSAWFNGGAVHVELLRAEGASADRFGVQAVAAQRPGAGTESQCGATDDRVPSNAANRARIGVIGCTANLTVDGCFITAGHCVAPAWPDDVIEFNVPLSKANGGLNHPAPSDQYVPTASFQFSDGGLGNDWGVFTVFPNSETGLTPLEAQGPGLEFATTLPKRRNIVEITGYGVDTGTANQTQQVSTGPVTSVSSSTNLLKYKSDTEGGNSGSAVLVGGRIVAIHTNGGCSTRGTGANSGTMIGNTGFRTAYAAVCGAPVLR